MYRTRKQKNNLENAMSNSVAFVKFFRSDHGH